MALQPLEMRSKAEGIEYRAPGWAFECLRPSLRKYILCFGGEAVDISLSASFSLVNLLRKRRLSLPIEGDVLEIFAIKRWPRLRRKLQIKVAGASYVMERDGLFGSVLLSDRGEKKFTSSAFGGKLRVAEELSHIDRRVIGTLITLDTHSWISMAGLFQLP